MMQVSYIGTLAIQTANPNYLQGFDIKRKNCYLNVSI